MARREGRRRLIVNADDFGRSTSINRAVRLAHRDGILTTASLMVGGEAFDEAVAIARATPTLGVGLHLTLVCGRAALPPREIPDLVDADGNFSDRAALAGWRYWVRRPLRESLRRELAAQFERFHATGLLLDHVNGHLHFHLHPVVRDLLVENHRAWGLRRVRLTRDSLSLSLRTSRGHWAYRVSHAVVFRALARRARTHFARIGWRHTDRVIGLLQDGRVDEAYLLRVLPRLPAGDSEIYCHPSLDRFRHELEALISPGVKAEVARLGFEPIRYQDL